MDELKKVEFGKLNLMGKPAATGALLQSLSPIIRNANICDQCSPGKSRQVDYILTKYAKQVDCLTNKKV